MIQAQKLLWVPVDNKGKSSSAAPSKKALRSHRANDWNRRQRLNAIALFRGDPTKESSKLSTRDGSALSSSRGDESSTARRAKYVSKWRLEDTRSQETPRPLRKPQPADQKADEEDNCTVLGTWEEPSASSTQMKAFRSPAPATLLDTGHFDPFNQTVIPLDEDMMKMLRLQAQLFFPRVIPTMVGDRLRWSLFQGMPHDPVVILSVCCSAVANLHSLASSTSDVQKFADIGRTRGLQLKVLAIREINTRLRHDQAQLYEASTAWAILNIVLYDTIYGTLKEVETHVSALRELCTLRQTRDPLPLVFNLTLTAIVNLNAAVHNRIPLCPASDPNWETLSEATRSSYFETSLRQHAQLASGLLKTVLSQQLSPDYTAAIEQLLICTIFAEAVATDPNATTIKVKDQFTVLLHKVTSDLLYLVSELDDQSSQAPLVEGIRLGLLAFIYSIRLNSTPTNIVFIPIASNIRRFLTAHTANVEHTSPAAQKCLLWISFMGFHLLHQDPSSDKYWFLERIQILAPLASVPSSEHSGDEPMALFQTFFYVDRVHSRSLKIAIAHLANKTPSQMDQPSPLALHPYVLGFGDRGTYLSYDWPPSIRAEYIST